MPQAMRRPFHFNLAKTGIIATTCDEQLVETRAIPINTEQELTILSCGVGGNWISKGTVS
jgi:hypothetical protein